MLSEEAIFERRQSDWRELQRLLGRCNGNFKVLSEDELQTFVRLYRQTSADLAYLMTHSSNQEVVDYLNALVGQAYAELYRAPRRPFLTVIQDSLVSVAQVVRRRRVAIRVAMVIFFAGIVVSYGLIQSSPGYLEMFVPPGMEETFEHWKSGEHEERTGIQGIGASFFYAQHNPLVSIVTAALSLVTVGIFGVSSMWGNGAMMGALLHEVVLAGQAGFLIFSVIPHGITEIGGIFMAGAAGFVMAGAIINPGRDSRAEALRKAGKDGFVLVILSLVMTMMAAPIEGFFSFDPRVPDWARIVVAAVTLFGWLAFFRLYGRDKESLEGAESPSR
ncbi:MAG: stage II sporulation protein M [Armatimonadetes bacterium]|nr:stage II sporulation protein M [Armatimonadota bacterium]